MVNFVSNEFVIESELQTIRMTMRPCSTEQFWLEKLVKGKLVHSYWDVNVSKERLYQEYRDFCSARNLPIDSYSEFDQMIFGQLLIDQNDEDKDYRPTGNRKSSNGQSPEQKLVHRVPDLERSRRLYLEARPDLVSMVTRERFTPRSFQRSRLFFPGTLMLLSGIVILAYQLYIFFMRGTWTSFSLFHFIELADWQEGLKWFSDSSGVSTARQLSQQILSYAELAVILLFVGLLVRVNTDRE